MWNSDILSRNWNLPEFWVSSTRSRLCFAFDFGSHWCDSEWAQCRSTLCDLPIELIIDFNFSFSLTKITIFSEPSWAVGACFSVWALHTGVHKIRGMADHRSIYSHALMTLTSSRWALWLMKAAGKPLNPNVTVACHFFRFHSKYFFNNAADPIWKWKRKILRRLSRERKWRRKL